MCDPEVTFDECMSECVAEYQAASIQCMAAAHAFAECVSTLSCDEFAEVGNAPPSPCVDELELYIDACI